jgi:beta-dihydromenaquinone-9 omega-hydroxylase
MPSGRYLVWMALGQARMAVRLAAINAGVAVWHSRAGATRVRRRLSHRGRGPSGGAALTRFDPYDPAVRADPHPAYRSLLAGPNLHYSRRRALWYVVRYDDVRAAARSHDTLSSAESVAPYRAHIPTMLTSDRPEHTRLRRLVTADFTRDAMERRRPAIERLAARSVDEMLADGETDAVARLASPLPVAVIAQLLGVPEADFPDFRDWSDKIVKAFALGRGLSAVRDSADVLGSTVKLNHYMAEQFERLRREPGDDVLSGLVASSDEGQLTADELFWFAFMLLVAGNETTTSLLGTMTLSFAQNPDQYARVREDPELVPLAVEEALRHGSPIQGLYRTASADHPVGDAYIPAGGRVLLLYGAANRDPRQYAEPDIFDVSRNPTDHVAFGSGIHFCLGAHLARLEGQVVLSELVRRVSAIELAGEPAWNENPSVRGLARLPVRLVPG